jgi:predicted amidohydrolase YtcJ
LRWKIEHGENLSDDSLRRMRALGMGYSIQSRMLYGGDRYIETRGMDVARRSPPIVSAMRMGLVVSGGSDGAVISPYNPFATLRWMLDGRTASGAQTRAPAELPSRMEALRIFTLNGAWGTSEENDRGSLEAGKLADLVILDRDYLNVPVEQVAAIRPLLTMVGGRPVFARAEMATLLEPGTGVTR